MILLFASALGALKAFNSGQESTPGQITLAAFVALGLAIYEIQFSKKILRTGICIIGIVSGYLIGCFIFSSFYIKSDNNEIILFILCGLGALILGVLSYRFDRNIIVMFTAFIGSYAFIRGISMFIGNFPNEIVIYQ